MRDFNHSVNVLVKAYINDTLEHGNCAACAVGNLIAANCGFEYGPREDDPNQVGWIGKTIFDFTSWYGGPNVIKENQYTISTGYSTDELSKIEKAFENDTETFESLMNVVEVLAEIHGINLSEKESAKALFVKA